MRPLRAFLGRLYVVRPRRRWARFSLLTLMLAVTLACLRLGVTSERARRQVALIARIERNRGQVYLAYEVDERGEPLREEDIPEPPLFVKWLGKGYGDIGHVDLKYGELTDEDCDVLACFSATRSLRSICADVDNKRFRLLRGMVQLRSLQLYQSSVSDEGLAALAYADDLESLDLPRAPIVGPGLVHLTNKHRLRTLNLSGTELTDEGLSHLRGLTQLESLALSGTRITDRGLADFVRMRNLESLDLSHTDIGDEGLASLAGLSQLKQLNLAGTRVKGAGLANLSGMASLADLDLSHTRVTDAAIADLPLLPGLRQVWLTDTHVADKGAARLAMMPTVLLDIGLEGTRIGDEGVAALANAPYFISSLDVSRCNVGDNGLAAIMAAPRIGRLIAADTLISDVGLDQCNRSLGHVNWSGTLASEAGAERYLIRNLVNHRIREWGPRPRCPRRPMLRDLAPLTRIAASDTADDLWRRGLTLAIALSSSVASDQSRRGLVSFREISRLFRAAVERAERPAPIFVAWGDSQVAPEDGEIARRVIQDRLQKHPEEYLLRRVLARRDPHEMCYAAAAALEPDWGAPWSRLAFLPARSSYFSALGGPDDLACLAAEALARRDPTNALAQYYRATNSLRFASDDDLNAWLEAGNKAPRLETYPTPFPSNVSASVDLPERGGPEVTEPVVPFKNARRGYCDGLDAICEAMMGHKQLDSWGQHADERLRRNFCLAVERLRDSGVAAGVGGFTQHFSFVRTVRPRSQDNARIEVSSAAPPAIAGNANDLFGTLFYADVHEQPLRLDRLLEDLLAAERAMSVETAARFQEHRFDGSLEWAAE